MTDYAGRYASATDYDISDGNRTHPDAKPTTLEDASVRVNTITLRQIYDGSGNPISVQQMYERLARQYEAERKNQTTNR